MSDESRGHELPKAYRPAEVERAVYARWLEADVFAPDGAGSCADPAKPPFVIIMPPPNVTGSLHLGHALTAALEDLMIRHARMQGRPALWLPGVDHASIAAQYVLDRIIAAEGETRGSLGRERYLERMWRFMDETRTKIMRQHHRLGASADWSRERFTMDPVSARAVRTSFRQLYDDGLAYRTEALINWCPGCRTSLSDLEVIARPETGTLWTVRYHLARPDATPDATAWIDVATTRPETILGDVAVAVHPEDDRYRVLVGREAVLPFLGRRLPIIADHVVDREFGTGAVKITPAHDLADHETGRRHGLPLIDVMEDDGRMSAAAGPFAGLDRYEARARILEALEAAGDLVEARPHEMIVGHCQRSDDVVEPRVKTQWFIRTRPLADKALAAVREGRTRIVPKRFEKVYFDWLENIRDWNVSRQLWWGHRIPAWYCPEGHVIVSDLEDGPAACAACGAAAAALTRDEDVFDTWYSSGLWPFSTLGWPERTPDLARYYPGSVMETGYDILFFWVARMMMLGLWLMGEEPFRVIYLHGLVRDPYGQKMSKSKANVVDPLEVIDEIGADALRFALLGGVAPGGDQRIGRAKLDGARNFANKGWNATRFVLGSRPAEVAADEPLDLPVADALGPAERWMLARLADDIETVERAMGDCQFGEATRLVYEGLWSAFADWYVELAKVRLGDERLAADERAATWRVLAWTLDTYLRLLHPMMPFVTEETWGRLPHRPGDAPLLAVSPWPDADEAARLRALAGTAEPAAVETLIALVRAIRNARLAARIDPASWLTAGVAVEDPCTAAALEALRPAVERLARIRPISVHRSREALHAAAREGALVVIAGALEASLTATDGDRARDRARLERELDEARRLLAVATARLADAAFVGRAPEAVVRRARERAAELGERVLRLEARLG